MEVSASLVKVVIVLVMEGVLHVAEAVGPIEGGLALKEEIPIPVQGGMLAPDEGHNDAHDDGREDFDSEATVGNPTDLEKARVGSSTLGMSLRVTQERWRAAQR